jgi:hypothetical protein
MGEGEGYPPAPLIFGANKASKSEQILGGSARKNLVRALLRLADLKKIVYQKWGRRIGG